MILCHYKCNFLHHDLNWKHSTPCGRLFNWKNYCYCSLIQNPDSPAIPKKTFEFEFLSKIKCIFHQTYRSFIFHQGPHRKLSHFGTKFPGKYVNLWSLHRCPDSPKIPKSGIFVHLPQYPNFFSSASRVWIPSSKTHMKTQHFYRSIEVKVRGFCSLDQNPGSLKFPSNIFSIIFLDIQTHPYLSPMTTGFISLIKVSIKNFSIVKTFSMETLSSLCLELKYWQPDIPNNAIYNVSSRYWNLIPCKQRLGTFHHGLCWKLEKCWDQLKNQTFAFFLALESW